MGFWAGLDDYLSYKLEQRDRQREGEQKRRDRITTYLLPLMVESQQKRKAKAQAINAMWEKGASIYGAKIATALQNTGHLEDVLENYQSTKSPEAYTKLVIANTEKYLDKLSASEDPKDHAKLANILKRIPTDDSSAKLSDYIKTVIADGVVTHEEYWDMPDIADVETYNTGGELTFGEPNRWNAQQIEKNAMEIAIAGIPGARIVETKDGFRAVFENKPPSTYFSNLANIQRFMTEQNDLFGGAEAFGLAVEKFVTQPAVAPPPVDVQEAPTFDTGTEAITEMPVEPKVTPPVPTEGGFSQGVLDERAQRFNR